MQTEVTRLLGIEYPIIQGGMAWVAEYHLAAGVSEAGGLGLIGAASAPADWVRDQVRKAKELTDKPFGVNIMLMSPYADEVAKVIVEEGVKVVTTGAGNPEKYMKMWKEAGVKVIPVVASVALAEENGTLRGRRLVAEGCEAADISARAQRWCLFRKSWMQSIFRLLLPEELQTEEESPPHLCWEQKVFRWEHILSLQMNPRYMRITKKESSKRRILIPK